MQHHRAIFWVFSDQQSISLSVKSIDRSHWHFLSRQQPRFLQATLQLHQSCYFQQQALSEIESISGWTFNLVSGFEKKSPAQRKSHWGNESESNEEYHSLDWSWNFNSDVSETFLNLTVHYPLDVAPEWICQTLHIMGVKCQMFINVIHTQLRLRMVSWVCHFRYKCSHLIKYLLGKSVERVFCTLSLHRTWAKYPYIQTSCSVNENII